MWIWIFMNHFPHAKEEFVTIVCICYPIGEEVMKTHLFPELVLHIPKSSDPHSWKFQHQVRDIILLFNLSALLLHFP